MSLNARKWFGSLCERVGFAESAVDAAYAELVERYGEKHRRYHTMHHIQSGWILIDGMRAGGMQISDAVEMAWWLHDAVYSPVAAPGANEEASAQLAWTMLQMGGCKMPFILDVMTLVRTTAHGLDVDAKDAERLKVDIDQLHDIDLDILGTDPERFEEYERGIRFEYKFAPAQLFCEKRAAVLQSFLDKDRIYRLDRMEELFGKIARFNLRTSIARLKAGVILE